MLNDKNSYAGQMRVKGKLDTFQLKWFMEEDEIADVSDGHSRMVTCIDEIVPQCHPDFRSDEQKISYIRRAVAERKEWSAIPLKRITSGKLSFNGFVAALHKSLQVLKEIEQILRISDYNLGTLRSNTHDTLVKQYGRNPKFWRRGLFLKIVTSSVAR